MVIRKIQSVNNALMINVPKALAEALELNKGNEMDIRLKDNKLIFEKVIEVKSK